MLGCAGSVPAYRFCRLWLSVAKPNVYRELSFSCSLSPALLLFFNKREKGAMLLPLSDYASLIEPTWLPPRLFDSSSQGRLLLPLPRGRRGGGYGPIRQSARHTPTFPLKRGWAKQRVHRLRGRVASLEPSSCLQGRRAAQKNGARGVPRAPQADGVLRCWI